MQFSDAYTVFLGIMVEALPFLLLGVLVSNLLHVFVSREALLKRIPTNGWGGILGGALSGFFFPVCECGNIPVARRMVLKGVPPYIVLSFLAGAPVLNPIVIAATWVAFREQPEIVWLRVLFTLVVVVLIGWSFRRAKPEEVLRPSYLCAESEPAHDHHANRWQAFYQHSLKEFFEMGSILTLGALLAASVQLVVPRSLLLGVGEGQVSSILAMMLLASVISICSNVDAFFALSFAGVFSDGAILAFLVWGPIIDLKALLMMSTTFRWRAIALLSAVAGLSSFGLSLLWNYWFS